MEGIRHDAMLATLGGILALLLGLGLMGLPLLALELSRPRDALWGAVVLLLGLVLVTSADRLVGAPMVAVLCGGLLIGRLGSEVALSRWRVLSPEEQQRLWSLERWQTSLQQLLVVLGELLGRLNRAVTGLMEWLRERRQSRSTGKRWVRQEEPEATAVPPEASADDATQAEDSPAAESTGEDAAALEAGGVEAAGGQTADEEHDSAPEACASEEDSPPDSPADLNDSAVEPAAVAPTTEDSTMEESTCEQESTDSDSSLEPIAGDESAVAGDESAAENASDLSSTETVGAEAVGVDAPSVEDPAVPEAAAPEPPSAEPPSAEPAEPVSEEAESPAESNPEFPEAPDGPEAATPEPPSEEQNEDSSVPEVRDFEEVDALLRAAPEAP
jgi:hypothetical protein